MNRFKLSKSDISGFSTAPLLYASARDINKYPYPDNRTNNKYFQLATHSLLEKIMILKNKIKNPVKGINPNKEYSLLLNHWESIVLNHLYSNKYSK